MSRELRCRAWDKENEVMCEVDAINWNMNTAMLKRDGVDAYGVEIKDIILMQYTGLKDKGGEGKESCDQDIICYPNDYPYSPETGKTSADINNDIGLIYWNDDECGFWVKTDEKARDQSDMPLGQLVDEYGDFEIIGNVHQTPELMENNNDRS